MHKYTLHGTEKQAFRQPFCIYLCMTIKEIIPFLPSGTQTRIAAQVGVSKQAVNKALHGQLRGAKSERIIKEAQAVYTEHQRTQEAAALRRKITAMTDGELLAWAAPLTKKAPAK